MSTKGLIADKRVAHVGLNDAGKAATLTLAAPWLYEGQRGPFTLNGVEHGHKIVKGAVSDGSTAIPAAIRAPRAAPTERLKEHSGDAALPFVQPDPINLAAGPPPAPRKGNGEYVYRYRCYSPSKDHEVIGWIKTTREYTHQMQLEESRRASSHAFKAGTDDYEITAYRWTHTLEKGAKASGNLGSPFSMISLNHAPGAE